MTNDPAAAAEAPTILLSTDECTVAVSRTTGSGTDPVAQGPDGSPTPTVGGDVAIVRITGEVDLANADDVHTALRGLVEAAPARIEIHLDGLDFIDSFGISRLMMAQQAALAAGVLLTLRGVRPATRRVFVISGLMSYLNVE